MMGCRQRGGDLQWGKCLPWVLLLANSCNSLSGNGGAASLSDPGSERLEGIMNTPGRAQGIWESLKHSSSSFWSSWGLAARAAAAPESSSLPSKQFEGRHSGVPLYPCCCELLPTAQLLQ